MLGKGKEKSEKIPVPATAYFSVLDTVCFHEQLSRN